MATIIYKKYIKSKRDKQPELCEHRRASQNTTAPVTVFNSIELPARSISSVQQTKNLATGYPEDEASNHPCPICKEENRRLRIYRCKIVAGLCLPFIVQALDTTIIAGALPFIASDFRKPRSPKFSKNLLTSERPTFST
jgi:hypothetical protein